MPYRNLSTDCTFHSVTSSRYTHPMLQHHLVEKREELMWALSLQSYSFQDIATIFNVPHRMTVMRIVARKPADWKPKWIKTV